MNFKDYIKYFFLYLLLAAILLSPLFFLQGSISGGDWSFPANFDQLKILFNSLWHSWVHTGSIFGSRQLSSTSIIFFGAIYPLVWLGLPMALIVKIFLILIFTLAGANMNLFLRYIGVKSFAAFITGVIFILTPVFFNYALMGWVYVLLSLALLPLFIYLFLRAIDEEKYSYALLSSVVFSIAVLQSQTLIWYPLALLFVIIGYCRGSKQIWLGIKYFFLILAAFVALNLYWLPSLLLLPDKGVTGSTLVWGADSIGTSYRLFSSNIMKLWGSLFNYQFETSYSKILWPLAYIIPILAFSALFYWRRYHRHLSYLIFIFLILVLVFSLDRSFIAKLPFSNIIRDVSRFTTLSTFALITMVGMTLDRLFSWRGNKLIIAAIVLILFINTLPFLTGKLFAGRVHDFDFRLRTKEWPAEYTELNDKLSESKTIDKVLFIPIGGRVSLTDDQKFNGSFNEITDVCASFAPVSGMTGLSSRGQGAVSELIYQIDQAISDQNVQRLDFLTRIAGVDLLVMRRDMQFYGWNQDKTANFELQLKELVKQGKAEIYFDRGSIFAIKLIPERKLISASSGAVEIKSNSSKILSGFINDKLISKEDYPQIVDLLELKDLFGDKAALTFDDQNLTYSQYISKEPKVYQFFSLADLSQKVPMTKWWLERRNLDKLLDSGLRAEGNQAISQLGKVDIGNSRGKYLVSTDNEVKDAAVYFRDDLSIDCPQMKINGESFNLNCQKDKTKILEHVNLISGFNTFQTDDNLTPLFVLTSPPAIPAATPEISFKNLSPVKYQISVKEIKDDFIIHFADNYNSYWQLTGGNGFFTPQIVADSNHFVSNGYGNGFKVKLADLEKAGLLKKQGDGTYSAEFYLEYQPQKYLVIGGIASIISFLIIVSFIIYKHKRRT
jgi:hypothetical protein